MKESNGLCCHRYLNEPLAITTPKRPTTSALIL
jgi:hypothetical protein